MKQPDVLYRALAGYKKQTQESRECAFERRAIVASNPESDAIEVRRTVCTVDEDWIEAIEKGLVHIEKAINENRQFIRSQGEVVPIEKVKRVSKDSVEHLAKHSDLITRMPQDGDIVPDKLFIVERLSDFAVYENRFLYMLLCYLNSFISYRYNKILDLTTTYNGTLTMNKTVAMNKRKLVLEMRLSDEKRDDAYLKEHNPLKAVIDRIDFLLKSVTHFLASPLMQEVAKSPMLKPPITKTNVLKMNLNFKGATALYDFVTAYDKQGFESEVKDERLSPLSEDVSGDLAEAVTLVSFLTYKHGLGLEKFFKSEYNIEEARRKAEEAERKREQLKQLKRRIAEHGGDTSEYLLMLEKHNKSLEQDAVQLTAARKEIERLSVQTDELRQVIESVNAAAEQLRAEIVQAESRRIEEIRALEEENLRNLTALEESHRVETEELTKRYSAEISALGERHSAEISALGERHSAEIQGLTETLKTETERRDGKIAELINAAKQEKEQFDKRLEDVSAAHKAEADGLNERYRTDVSRLTEEKSRAAGECERLRAEKSLTDSMYNALRREHKLIGADEDFTSRASFSELEHQLNVLKSFVREEWKKTKKRIRKEVLSNKETLSGGEEKAVQDEEDKAT